MKKNYFKKIGIILILAFLPGLAAVTLYSRHYSEMQKPLVNTILPQSAEVQWCYEAITSLRHATQTEKGRMQPDDIEWVVDMLIPFNAFSYLLEELMALSSEFFIEDKVVHGRFVTRYIYENGDIHYVFAFIGDESDFDLYLGKEVNIRVAHIGIEYAENLVPFDALHLDFITGEFFVNTISEVSGAWGVEYVIRRIYVAHGLMPRVGSLAHVLTDLQNAQIVTTSSRPLWDGMTVRLNN